MAAFEYKGVCCRCKTAEVVCPPVMDPDWTPEEQADVRAGWEETRVELEAETPAGEARRVAFIRALMENLMCKPCAAANIKEALQEAVRQHQERADHPVVSDGMPACDIRGCKRQSCGYAEVALCNPDGSAIPLTSTIVLSDGRRQPASEPTRLWICASHSAQAEETGLQGMQVAFTVEAAPAAIILAEGSRKRPTTDAEIAEACANGRQYCDDCRVTTCCDNTNIKEKARLAREKNHAGDLLDPATEAEQVRVSGMWQANVFELTPDEMKALGKFNTVERLTGEEARQLACMRDGGKPTRYLCREFRGWDQRRQPDELRFPDDVARIVRALAAIGVSVDADHAEAAWAQFSSERRSAGWYDMKGACDSYVVEHVLGFIEPVGEEPPKLSALRSGGGA